ncbi:MAG: hypothetical protein DCC55_11205 [Chloroflexi bacterium]|nr:MAG: hypothetical protein DCC55_11205 [Chloroflexota bacterium]
MINHEKLRDNAEEFRRATGLTIDEFDRLLPTFAALYEAKYAAETTVQGQPRQRRAGGGAKGKLNSMEDKLLFILSYQKRAPLQTKQGQDFGLSQSQTNEWLHRLRPVLDAALAEQEAGLAGSWTLVRKR